MSALFFLPGKIFALVVGIYYIKYLPLPYKLVLLLIAIALFCESYGYYLSHFLHSANAWLFNFYIIIEASLLGIAGVYLITSHKIKKLFFLLLIINMVVWLGIIVHNTIYVFDTLSMVLGSSILTLMFIIVLYNNILFNNEKTLKQPVFWLSLSTILYFGCDIPYMGLHNYMAQHMLSTAVKLDNINMILDKVRYPLVAISFILLGRQKQVGLTAA